MPARLKAVNEVMQKGTREYIRFGPPMLIEEDTSAWARVQGCYMKLPRQVRECETDSHHRSPVRLPSGLQRRRNEVERYAPNRTRRDGLRGLDLIRWPSWRWPLRAYLPDDVHMRRNIHAAEVISGSRMAVQRKYTGTVWRMKVVNSATLRKKK